MKNDNKIKFSLFFNFEYSDYDFIKSLPEKLKKKHPEIDKIAANPGYFNISIPEYTGYPDFDTFYDFEDEDYPGEGDPYDADAVVTLMPKHPLVKKQEKDLAILRFKPQVFLYREGTSEENLEFLKGKSKIECDPPFTDRFIDSFFKIMKEKIITSPQYIVKLIESKIFHPKLEEFKKALYVNPVNCFKTYIYDKEGDLIHELKQVDDDLFCDDAGSEIELDGESLINAFVHYLSIGYIVQVGSQPLEYDPYRHKLKVGALTGEYETDLDLG